MWSPDRRRAVLGAAAALAVAGCGFRPLYGEGGGALRGQVSFEATEGRAGYFFRQQLRRRFGDPVEDAPYVLETRLALRREGYAISATDEVTRFDVVGQADFVLRRRADGSEAAQGTATATTAYSTTATPYATDVAQRDAERRVAVDLADRVFARVAALRIDEAR